MCVCYQYTCFLLVFFRYFCILAMCNIWLLSIFNNHISQYRSCNSTVYYLYMYSKITLANILVGPQVTGPPFIALWSLRTWSLVPRSLGPSVKVLKLYITGYKTYGITNLVVPEMVRNAINSYKGGSLLCALYAKKAY